MCQRSDPNFRIFQTCRDSVLHWPKLSDLNGGNIPFHVNIFDAFDSTTKVVQLYSDCLSLILVSNFQYMKSVITDG